MIFAQINEFIYVFCEMSAISSLALCVGVRGPSYLSLIRSISLLLMPWLLASPGHQQPRYWLGEIGRSWSFTRNDSNHPCHVNVED